MAASSQSDEFLELIRKVEAAPRDAGLHRELGLKYWHAGRLVDALVEFRKMLKIDAADREAVFALAAISFDRAQPWKTHEHLFEIVSSSDFEPGRHPEFRWTALEKRFASFPAPYDRIDWRELFEDAEKKIRLDPGYAERAIKEGGVCHQQRCYDKAIRIFTRLAVLDPRNPEVRLRRAMALSARRRDAEAETEFAEAILLQPLNPEAYKGLALVRARTGETEKAKAAFEQVLKLDPADPDARRWLEKTG
jgi:tetratricopeptide (TPR) repeat protein